MLNEGSELNRATSRVLEPAKRLFRNLFYAAVLVLAASCMTKTDPELEQRISRLESRVDQLNEDLASLSRIVNALRSGDWVTEVSPVTEEHGCCFLSCKISQTTLPSLPIGSMVGGC